MIGVTATSSHKGLKQFIDHYSSVAINNIFFHTVNYTGCVPAVKKYLKADVSFGPIVPDVHLGPTM